MRFAPIVNLAWRKAAEAKRLHRENDALRSELAVQRRRTTRWRRAAHELAAGNPAAMRVLAWQSMSDDIADAPEIDPDRRNAPRSAP